MKSDLVGDGHNVWATTNRVRVRKPAGTRPCPIQPSGAGAMCPSLTAFHGATVWMQETNIPRAMYGARGALPLATEYELQQPWLG